MSDIKSNPIKIEKLKECTPEELSYIRGSWEYEKKKLESELEECESVLAIIRGVEEDK